VPEKDQLASFAKAITRDEFGRFYWDERRESEVRRSLASAMARVKEERRACQSRQSKEMSITLSVLSSL
jgi:hypothetical protein